MTNENVNFQNGGMIPNVKKIENSPKRIIAKVITYLILSIFVLWIFVPFYIIIISSVKSDLESMSPIFTWWPKQGFSFEAYKRVFTFESSSPNVLNGFLNTLWVVLPPTIIGLLASSLSAYAFAKLRFKCKNLLFSILIMTMMIPGVITLAPTYVVYDMIYWVGTPLPLMIPGMFGAAACVFFMRQFFFSIPTELIESAKLDGMGYLKIFFRIMVPLAMPALIAQGVLGFLGGYNDYFGPLLYLLNKPELYTLQIALARFGSRWASRSRSTLLAGAVVALIPTLVLYVAAQRYFIEGIATSGMKL